ncbi:tRNA pseudouridine synthase Pus10 protein [Marine Group I thaumarchaeote SCGC AAA799-B03]|uniref:tRNA pseudouridine(55) synthase n=6 Tax=Marine Group I TaxID=905826 RepID=A0A087S7H9_9ARCH|nr:tRNA pseudouridine synthase Pus10 protein [Marine Group I thaumarchaeote SCGC AAA799-N04]KFM16928.1 tRNA pseudouridine synthase Pus10 protein [Marine Group I thaumarchaeote SCGC AAA799-D11]KFM18619.1 tRNA pseudouridine synthase Pus10 protein [Marine Group I thaumarchaeote SCGC RSA3]KFM21683.1 tRNA pseudouridine synthase Pus10 protein [Marine Group I thaumarchaeote SCGC AAA799-B03]
MTNQKIVPIANQILKKYDLCDNCLGRLFSKQLHLSSNKLLGKKLKKNSKSTQRCYICKNLFDNLNYFLNMMLDSASSYSYFSFSVGAIIKPSIIDRDDTIRSKFKLKGIDGIKTDITKELGKLFSRKTKKTFDYLDPEIVFTVNLKEESCDIRSKSLTLSGRYVKSVRGFPQKQKSCTNCSGKGCRICDFHGITEYDSVEGEISQFLFEKLGGTTAKFTWIGGEDKSSLILGTGRPFFVKIQNPHKRNLRAKSANLEHVEVRNLKIVSDSPKKPLKFNSLVEAKISASSKIDSNLLRKLKTLTENPIVVYEKSGKRSEKRILSIKYKKHDDVSFTLFFKFEGGLPVKRFVTGDDVSPGISQIIGVSCKCLEFDFHDVEVK